jgi:hypothetical protein
MIKCDCCHKEFNTKKTLNIHLKKFHPDEIELNFKCKLCDYKTDNIGGLKTHYTKIHNSLKDEYFEECFNESCLLCGKKLKYLQKFRGGNFCDNSHYYSYRNKINGKTLTEKCSLCDSQLENCRQLGAHLTKAHKFVELDVREYYNKFYRKDVSEGQCKWCKKETRFIGLTHGYMEFCHNTSCNVYWHNKNENRHEKSGKTNSETIKNFPERQSTTLQYWINKGYNEEEAKQKLSERQTTFSKKICIEKYGEIEGLEVWKKRQEKWTKNFNKIGGFSKISQEMFFELYDKIKHLYKKIYFASIDEYGNKVDNSNNEYRIKTKNTVRLLDFYVLDINKCIEFDGDYWHGNKPGNKIRDELRENEIFESNPNIKIFHVKEKDYNLDKNKIIQDCLEFLNG